ETEDLHRALSVECEIPGAEIGVREDGEEHPLLVRVLMRLGEVQSSGARAARLLPAAHTDAVGGFGAQCAGYPFRIEGPFGATVRPRTSRPTFDACACAARPARDSATPRRSGAPHPPGHRAPTALRRGAAPSVRGGASLPTWEAGECTDRAPAHAKKSPRHRDTPPTREPTRRPSRGTRRPSPARQPWSSDVRAAGTIAACRQATPRA